MNNRKVFQKRVLKDNKQAILDTDIEFIATSEYFIKQQISREQLRTIHYSLLDYDIVHSLNNCKNYLGESCKQGIGTILQIHSDVLKLMNDSNEEV